MKYWEANFYTVPFRETIKHPHTHVPTVNYILSLGWHPTLWCHYVLVSHTHAGNYVFRREALDLVSKKEVLFLKLAFSLGK